VHFAENWGIVYVGGIVVSSTQVGFKVNCSLIGSAVTCNATLRHIIGFIARC
jgi:hypothetical protein